jgi:uncharacterized protein (TIGR04255 family)
MANNFPKSLEKDLVVEAIFEIRFQSNFPEEALAGLLYNHYREDVSNGLEKLPHLQVPELIRKQDPNLQFMPLYRISMGNLIIQIGSNNVSLINTGSGNYLGWSKFFEKIKNFVSVVFEITAISEATRCSLRYIDFFERNATEVCNISLNNSIKYDRKQIYNTEIYRNGNFHVKTTMATEVIIENSIDIKKLKGSIIDTDVSLEMNLPETELPANINSMHDIAKEVFFSLLKPEFITGLGPKYE